MDKENIIKTVALYVILSVIPCFLLQAVNENSCNGDKETTEVFIIEPLSSHYSSNDTIYLPLINVSEHVIYYSLSLEINAEDQWESLVADVYKSPLDKYEAQNIRIIPSGEIIIVPLVLSDLLTSEELSDYDKKFRFCILAKKTPFDKEGEKYCSTIFFLANKEI